MQLSRNSEENSIAKYSCTIEEKNIFLPENIFNFTDVKLSSATKAG